MKLIKKKLKTREISRHSRPRRAASSITVPFSRPVRFVLIRAAAWLEKAARLPPAVRDGARVCIHDAQRVTLCAEVQAVPVLRVVLACCAARLAGAGLLALASVRAGWAACRVARVAVPGLPRLLCGGSAAASLPCRIESTAGRRAAAGAGAVLSCPASPHGSKTRRSGAASALLDRPGAQATKKAPRLGRSCAGVWLLACVIRSILPASVRRLHPSGRAACQGYTLVRSDHAVRRRLVSARPLLYWGVS